jgi:predicted transcriptional regulator
VKAKLTTLTEQLSKRPEMVEELELVEDEAIQRMFTPERLAVIDEALAEVKAGKFFTAAQVDEHFAQKDAAWIQSHRP